MGSAKKLLLCLAFALLLVHWISSLFSETDVFFKPPRWESASLRNRPDLFFSEPLISEVDEKPPILFLVNSAPGNHDRRGQIRATWAKQARRFGFPVAFLVGRASEESVEESLAAEQRIRGDLLRVDTLDTYMNLTLKSNAMFIFAGMKKYTDRFVVKVRMGPPGRSIHTV